MANRGSDLATARGQAVEQRYEVIERCIGEVRAAVAVRYSK